MSRSPTVPFARALLLLAALPGSPVAQDWGSPATGELVRRAVALRSAALADTGLARYRARAEGVVLFLAQLGRAPDAAPRLVKADQVAVEVYWEAPNRSKQIITAWRERRYLPTDIRYHRDHLGVVTNDFGDAIRLGGGDEVRDVAHPVSAAGMREYEYALGDSVMIQGGLGRTRADEGGPGEVRVREVRFRPVDPAAPAAVGSLYLDLETAVLVRLRFGFTRAAYRQADLEDITVELESALFEQRYWLPYRQEIEIRRRTAWLDFPVRTIIRGRWTLGDYELERGFPTGVIAGGPYGGLAAPAPDTGWSEPLEAVVTRSAGPVRHGDLDEVRREVEGLVGAGAIVARPPARLAFGSVSDLVHVNRVQGLALGAGGSFAFRQARLAVEPRIEIGTSDGRVLGGLAVVWTPAATRWMLEARRTLRDVSDWPVISGALNSILAQEAGRDFGDYVLLERSGLAGLLPLGSSNSLGVGLGIERSRSVATSASPASGSYRTNPALGVGTLTVGRLAVRSAGRPAGGSVWSEVSLEGGVGARDYVRATFQGSAEIPAGAGTVAARLFAGAGSRELPPYRAFPLGGRGTLVGEPFRGFGGRRAVLGRVEWQIPVAVPEIRLGTFARSGPTAVLAPYFAMGAAGGRVDGGPWDLDAGFRPILGVAGELLFRVLRLEVGWGVRTGRIGVTVDASPFWWPIL